MRYEKLKKGGIKIKAPIRTGRPSSNMSFWTRTLTNSLSVRTPILFKTYPRLEDIDQNLNPHVQTLVCDLCNDLVHRPVLISNCEHLFCLFCLTRKVENVNLSNLNCPKCGNNFSDSQVNPAKRATENLGLLRKECSKGCGEKILLKDDDDYERHVKSCKGKSVLSVDDILKIPLGGSFPKNVERAAVHVIKSKMALSTLPNKGVALNTGSSRVSVFSS